MKVIEDMVQWQQIRHEIRGSVGFVPTMGALHDGHASLLRRSAAVDDVTVLSIYVNPTQFNDADDLASYPDTLDADLERRCAGMDIHPAGELAGEGSSGGHEAWLHSLEKARVAPGTRSLRIRVLHLDVSISSEIVELGFSLGRGCYATSLLREIATVMSSAQIAPVAKK